MRFCGVQVESFEAAGCCMQPCSAQLPRCAVPCRAVLRGMLPVLRLVHESSCLTADRIRLIASFILPLLTYCAMRCGAFMERHPSHGLPGSTAGEWGPPRILVNVLCSAPLSGRALRQSCELVSFPLRAQSFGVFPAPRSFPPPVCGRRVAAARMTRVAVSFCPH